MSEEKGGFPREALDKTIDRLMMNWHVRYSPTNMWNTEEKGKWTLITNNLLKRLKEQANPQKFGEILTDATVELKDLGTEVVTAFAERNRIKTMETLQRRLRVQNIGCAVFKSQDYAHIDEILKNGRFVRTPKKS